MVVQFGAKWLVLAICTVCDQKFVPQEYADRITLHAKTTKDSATEKNDRSV